MSFAEKIGRFEPARRPLPWKTSDLHQSADPDDTTKIVEYCDVLDADGHCIASCLNKADAELIVSAVNEKSGLKDEKWGP